MHKKYKITRIQAGIILLDLIIALFAFAIIINANFGVVSAATDQSKVPAGWKVASGSEAASSPAYTPNGESVVKASLFWTSSNGLQSWSGSNIVPASQAVVDRYYPSAASTPVITPNADGSVPGNGRLGTAKDSAQNSIDNAAADQAEKQAQADAAAKVKAAENANADAYDNMAKASAAKTANGKTPPADTSTATGLASLFTAAGGKTTVGSKVISDTTGSFIIQSGGAINGNTLNVKVGDEVKLLNPQTASTTTVKITNDNINQFNGKTLTDATAEQMQFGDKTVTLGGKTISQYDAITNHATELAKDPEALKTMGAKSVTPNSDGSVTIDKGEGASTTIAKDGSVTSTTAGSSALSKFLKLSGGGTWDALATGLQWGVIAWGAGQLVGSLLGFNSDQKQALSLALGGGAFIYQAFDTAKAGSFLHDAGIFNLGGLGPAAHPFIWGLGVAVVIFLLLYKTESQKVVTFTCLPWEAPTGGANCGKCNDEMYACSEYRCKSLGQACQLLNAGTGHEKCAWVNPGDVKSAIIKPWTSEITKDHSYKPNTAVRPPDTGVKIVYNQASDGCIKAFTPLTFGILTQNEDGSCKPAQCKIGYNRTTSYDNMQFYFGGSSLYDCNHTQTMSLPSPNAINAEAPELKNDGKYNLYVKCKDANNNANDDLFVINFCVQAGADVTPPVVESTSIVNGAPVQYNLNQTPIEVYVNEPADCKYSIGIDKEYTQMENNMTCSQHIYELNNQALYKCAGTLKGLQNGKDNDYYFKCRDQPLLGDSNDRNIMQESYKFTLKGSANSLVITSIMPNGTVQSSGNLAEVFLDVRTEFGSGDGNALCNYYCNNTIPANFGEKYYTQMLETGTTRHLQQLNLDEGNWICKVQCFDLGGNSASNQTSFTVKLDNNPPEVERIYNEAGKLKVITDKKATCSYSNNDDRQCLFNIADGTNMPYSNSTDHFADWNIAQTYYIRCMDINGKQPDAGQCSIVVKPRS